MMETALRRIFTTTHLQGLGRSNAAYVGFIGQLTERLTDARGLS